MSVFAPKIVAASTKGFLQPGACSQATNTALSVKTLKKLHSPADFSGSEGHHKIYLFGRQQGGKASKARRGDIDIHKIGASFAGIVRAQGISHSNRPSTFNGDMHSACGCRPPTP